MTREFTSSEDQLVYLNNRIHVPEDHQLKLKILGGKMPQLASRRSTWSRKDIRLAIKTLPLG
jgi:hypothetical protein